MSGYGLHRNSLTFTSDESNFNSLECWDYSVEIELASGAQDLQLAAELGKTLLERNKELENSLRKQQTVIDDQSQEIEYLTKQTAALREVNDSRLRIYEQLEVSIQDLERNNQRLAVENAADKKQIKSLCHSLDTMEGRCEELTRKLEEAQAAERKRQRNSLIETGGKPLDKAATDKLNKEEADELTAELVSLKAQKDRESRRAEELEEQLTALIQENASLEEEITAFRNREEQLRNLEEEISSMQGHQVCFRCMRSRGVGTGASTATQSLIDEDMSSSIMEDESCLDDETDTEVQSIASETHNTVLSDNPYSVLIEKYEALLSMQRKPGQRTAVGSLVPSKCASPAPGMLGRLSSPQPCLSLQEELQMSGEFSSGPMSLTFEDFGKVEEGEPRELQKLQPGTGQLYFSEAETNSSSGVSEGDMPRQQHRSTQTDLMSGGGKLLWSISAGNSTDCVVNVYDEAGSDPTETRFQRTPEYRELFSEIFTVLKRSVAKSAAERAEKELIAAESETKAKKKVEKKKSSEPKVRGQAEEGEEEAGTIEPIDRTETASPSSILSLSSGSKKARKARARRERKAELRRKVLSLSPERLQQEKVAAAAAEQAGTSGIQHIPPTPPPPAPVTMPTRDQRDQSPALSERSDRSGRGRNRHWAKRGKTFAVGNSTWSRWQQPPPPSPLATNGNPSTSASSQQAPPPPPGSSNVQTMCFTSSASADVARLKRLEKTYAEALRTSSMSMPMPKHRRK